MTETINQQSLNDSMPTHLCHQGHFSVIGVISGSSILTLVSFSMTPVTFLCHFSIKPGDYTDTFSVYIGTFNVYEVIGIR